MVGAVIVRVTAGYQGLRPGDVVNVDPRQKRIKQLMAGKNPILVPEKKQL